MSVPPVTICASPWFRRKTGRPSNAFESFPQLITHFPDNRQIVSDSAQFSPSLEFNLQKPRDIEGLENLELGAHRHPGRRLGRCQPNANRSSKCQTTWRSGSQLTPLGQGGRAILIEDVAAAELTVPIEVVVDRGVNGSEFLQRLDFPEPGHRSFSSSERLM